VRFTQSVLAMCVMLLAACGKQSQVGGGVGDDKKHVGSGNSTITVSSGSLVVKTTGTWMQFNNSNSEYYTTSVPSGGYITTGVANAQMIASIPSTAWGTWSVSIASHSATISVNASDSNVHAVAAGGGSWTLSDNKQTLTHSNSNPPANVLVLTRTPNGDTNFSTVCTTSGDCGTGTQVVCIGGSTSSSGSCTP